jgi:diazepam-binding inhibitor (GABA receptor modulating acyl-CoA-binding protein)
MTDLQTAFETAVAESKGLSQRPDNMTLLRLYALYKQASQGDNDTDKPAFSDMVGRAKWDAWKALNGISPQAAMQSYVDLVQSLQ